MGTTTAHDDRSRLSAFSYAVAEKAGLYVAVMDAFVRARDRYMSQLTLAQLRAELDGDIRERLGDPRAEVGHTTADLEAAVEQLTAWGNIVRAFDPTAPRTLRDFYGRRWLYQLTDVGLAAHQGVAAVLAGPVGSGGRLSTVLLESVADHLDTLAKLAERVKGDGDIGAELSRAFSALFGVSAQLTDYSARYMADLALEVPRIAQDEQALASYKQAVIAYLEGFVSSLSWRAANLSETVAALDPHIGGLAALADAVDKSPGLPEGNRPATTDIERRWQGVRDWFLDGGQASRLRDAMLQSICRLLEAMELVGLDQQPISRAQGFFSLADQFAGSTDAEAHTLFDVSFGAYGTRHFVHEAGDESVWRGSPFSAADPVVLAPRLRRAGVRASPGRPGARADFSRAKARQLAVLRERQRKQLAARQGLAGRTPAHLSGVGELGADEFSELLALVSTALDGGRAVLRRARTGEAEISIGLEARQAALETVDGVLVGPDLWLDVQVGPASESQGLA